MFILYQSNDLDVLKNILVNILKNNEFNKIELKENIIIQNNNLSFILKLFFAEYFGIYANYNFIIPSKFIWNIFRIFIPEIPLENYFYKYNLVSVIMSLLPSLIELKEFKLVKDYLKNDNNNEKLFFFSLKISELYEKYLIYRVDWLYKWQNFKLVKNLPKTKQIWQSILWREILNYFLLKYKSIWNMSNIYYKFLILLKKKQFDLNKLPKRIFIFNVLFLPPIYINIFNFLSKYIDVHFFIFNVSLEYWYEKSFFFNKKNNSLNFLYKDINFLIFNYGKSFYEYFSLLLDINFCEINSFYKYKNITLLDKIKNNVLLCNNLIKNKKNKYINIDNSITINYCYSYLEEVKLLKIYILSLLKNNKYDFDDIIVLVSKPKIYFYYINAIFPSLYKKNIPFFFIDKNIDYYKDMFNLYLKLLNLPNLDFNSDEIIYILEKKYIQDKFEINNNEIEVINNIISNVGICFGLKNLFNKNNINNYDHYTWFNGIKRILLGYAINEDFCIWNKIVPYSNIGSSFLNEIIGKLSYFFFKLIFWIKILKKKYYFFEWIEICKNLLNDFFNKNDINKCIFFSRKNWNNLLKFFKIGNFNKKFSVNLLINIIYNFFKNKKEKNNYSIGHINFCSFFSMRGINFKVICFLGLNDKVIPRKNYYNNLDLMCENFRFGDKNKNENDKYIFLEYLISAKEKIYISYICYSLDNNEKIYPSILVNILKDYIFYFYKNYYDIIFLKKKNKKIYFEYLFNNNNNIIIKNKNINKNFYNLKKEIKEFSLEKICLFWYNPIKFFFFNVLKINYDINKQFILKKELFIPNIKDFYSIRLKIINYFLNNRYILNEEIIYCLQSFNLLPVNSFGKVFWEKEKKNIFLLLNNIKSNIFSSFNSNFFLKIRKFKIYGSFIIGKNFGVIKWYPKIINFIDGLILLICHLIYCSLGGCKKSYLYGYNGIWFFNPIKKKIAKNILYKYVNIFFKSFSSPLLFFPRSSNIWISNAYDLKNKKLLNNFFLLNLAKKKLNNVLYGNNYFYGELNDLYISRLINDFKILIDEFFVIKQAEKFLLPVLKFVNFI